MPAEQLSPASVIRQTFGMIGRDREVFLLLALLLAGLPAWLSGMVAPPPPPPDTPLMLTGELLLRELLPSFIAMLLAGLLQAMLIHQALTQAAGRPVPVGTSFARALQVLLPLAALFLLEGLAVGIGLAMLLVPGIILLCCWAVSLPVLVMETAGPVEALRRSTALTRGNRGAVLTLGVMFVGMNAAVLIVAWFLATLFPVAGPLSILALAVSGLANAVLSILTATGMAALYEELRRISPAA
jgi:hypothetical protein